MDGADYLLFRLMGESGVPTVRHLAWFKDPAKQVPFHHHKQILGLLMLTCVGVISVLHYNRLWRWILTLQANGFYVLQVIVH